MKKQTQTQTLGFYADGTPRTLTDEQIAIFRHSEIWRLRRERERRAQMQADERP